MSSYARTQEIVADLVAGGVNATGDPRSATPPCVLVNPPGRDYDLAWPHYTARWELWALVPGLGNADAHKALDALVDDVANVLTIRRATLRSYVLSSDAPPLPAYQIEFEEGI